MNELKRHKKSDKIKWIITAVCFVLLFAFMAGLCMQLFAKDEKYKPSEWFKPNTGQTQPDTDENKNPATAAMNTALDKRIARVGFIAPDTVQSYGANVTDEDMNYLGLENCTYETDWNALLTVKNSLNNSTANSRVKFVLMPVGGVVPVFGVSLLVPKDNVCDISGCVLDSVVVKVNGSARKSMYSTPNCYYYSIGAGGDVRPNLATIPVTSVEVIYNLTRVENPIPLPDDPVKEGHTFTGWYFGVASDHNDNCTKYDGSPIYSDTKLHAHFRINQYIVTFISDGGSSVNRQFVDWNTAASLTTPTRDGYAFKGWFLPNGTQYTNQGIKENTTLTARWELNRFTITFNSDGGSAVENKAVMLNNPIPLTTPSKEGYNFKGWFMSDGTQYTNQPVTNDMTLTARWEIKTFTVTFYVDGEVYDTKTVEYGSQLVQVADEANVYAQNIVSFEYINEDIPDTEAVKMLVVDDMKVYATKATDTDKIMGTVKNNKWAIIGGVAGGIALIAVIAGIVSGAKRKRR